MPVLMPLLAGRVRSRRQKKGANATAMLSRVPSSFPQHPLKITWPFRRSLDLSLQRHNVSLLCKTLGIKFNRSQSP